MAQVNATTLTASGNLRLADAGDARGCTWVIQLSGGSTGTVKFQGIVKDTGGALTLGSNAVDLAFVNATSGATVAGGTGATADGIYFVRADGLDVQINWVRTAGSLTVSAYAVFA